MDYHLSPDKSNSEEQSTYPQLSLNQSEEKVWQDFTRGSNTALSFIYRKYADSLFNYGMQFADEDAVYDAIQDLFYDLIRNRHKLGEAKNIKSYLYASLRRKILKSRIKHKNELSQSTVEDKMAFKMAVSHEDPLPLLNVNTEDLQLLQKACNQLPEKQREAIILHFYEKMPYEELARILKVGKVKSARALVYRAVENLRTMLDGHRDELIIVLIGFFSFRQF
ncbi:MAG: sigma-70 family RNA polymerase sigma factor [Cyclobacteriaceae bacterium]|nr:sigma-70 family RNA polymerase sigma factor [Cyclobacteriaceae bacterium]